MAGHCDLRGLRGGDRFLRHIQLRVQLTGDPVPLTGNDIEFRIVRYWDDDEDIFTGGLGVGLIAVDLANGEFDIDLSPSTVSGLLASDGEGWPYRIRAIPQAAPENAWTILEGRVEVMQ